jgi:hypothetical protein
MVITPTRGGAVKDKKTDKEHITIIPNGVQPPAKTRAIQYVGGIQGKLHKRFAELRG